MTKYVNRNGKRIAVETMEPKVKAKRQRDGLHIGFPLTWLERVYPAVRSKAHLLVAQWLYRLSVIHKGKPFPVSNAELRRRFGIDRWTKYRALHHLEKVGAIALTRDGKNAIQVQMLW
jgi:hypothetical protein